MKLTYKKISIFVIAGVAYIVGQYFSGVWWPRTTWPFQCHLIISKMGTYCNPVFIDTFGWPLIILGQSLAIVAIILVFANASIFKKWFRFSLYYIPIATALTFWMYPIKNILVGIVPISRGVYLFGNLYAIITAFI
ncbi:hypothetical protein MNBD_CPR01-607, partial [hydrothermal vent metagenome]